MSNAPERNPKWDAYHMALGRFMRASAEAENAINGLLIEYVEERYDKKEPGASLIAAVIGGIRLKPMLDTFRRVVRLGGMPLEAQTELAEIFGHLGEIQFLRDKLAHNAVYREPKDEPGWFGVTNVRVAREKQSVEDIIFSVDTLDAATSDLNVAVTFVDRLLHPLEWAEMDRARESDPSFVGHTAYGAWRYKASALERTGRASQTKPPKRQRLPQPPQK